MAGSAAFQSIRLKLLRYQNVNAAAVELRRPAGKSVGEGSLREFGRMYEIGPRETGAGFFWVHMTAIMAA
jgi:hypothetical protein